MVKLPRHTNLMALLCLLSSALILLPARLVPAQNNPQNNLTLRKTVASIHCADNRHEAERHLRNLQNLDLFLPGLPNESTKIISSELRATTLDKVLQILAKSAVKFPENKALIEQTVIQWNFCSVLDNDTVYDHLVVNGKTKRYRSARANQESWSGFHTFGLVPDRAHRNTGVPVKSFDFTTPYTNSIITSLADRKLQQRFIDNCLPHPDDKHLYRNHGRNAISRIIRLGQNQSPLQELDWNPECQVESLVLVDAILDTERTATFPMKNIHVQTALPDAEKPKEIEPLAVESPTLAAAFDKRVPPVLIEVISEASTPNIESNPKPPKQIPTSVTVPIPVNDIGPSAIQFETTPRAVTGPWSGNGVISTESKKQRGFSGSISIDNRGFLSRNTGLGFAVSYKPFKDSYWFIRSSVSISKEVKPLTYSWGIGYDDWHAGTWAVQLNNWGPLKPGDGLDIRNAVAEVSYKLKKPWLEKYNLSSSISLSKTIADNPSLSWPSFYWPSFNWGWSWNPYSHWFVRSTLIKPLGESGLDWSYGFGYTRYENKSLSLEYNNWGPNEFPQPNFKKNSLVSLIYRWAF